MATFADLALDDAAAHRLRTELEAADPTDQVSRRGVPNGRDGLLHSFQSAVSLDAAME